MKSFRTAFAALFLALGAGAGEAAVLRAGTADELAAALEKAADGDTVILSSGVHKGNFTVKKPITLKGETGAEIDAEGKGSAIRIASGGVTLSGLKISNFGSDLYELNSGVLIEEGTSGTRLQDLTIRGPGFGIRADGARGIQVTGCDIRGEKRMHVLDRGDGVSLKKVSGAFLGGNTVIYTRDGFYFEDTDHTASSGNYLAGVQYGIHYMYDKDDFACGNKTEAAIGGLAVMSSSRVALHRNITRRTVEFGILINLSDGVVAEGNLVEKTVNPRGRRELDTEGKALFVYGGGKNEVEGNIFSESDIGAALALGGEGTKIWGNTFSGNKLQVRYVGTGSVEWSRNGRGNYWSTYQGWDLDGDGVGDRPFQPNDSLDRLFWLHPEARFLMESPVVVLLRFLLAQFEVDRGRGVTDSHPLMSPPPAKPLPEASS